VGRPRRVSATFRIVSDASPPPIRRTLADGRELLYFDDQPGRHHDGKDLRDLPAQANASEIRWDAVAREWAVIAGHRQQRTYKPPTSECPLCPTHGETLTEIPEPDYDVVVFENRFASLSTQAAEFVPVHDVEPFRSGPGIGRCEVVVFTSDHNAAFRSLPARRVRTIVDAWAQRSEELARLAGVGWVYCFENRGDEIGVTLAHPHGQIYAYPFVPTRLERAAQTLFDHNQRTGSCLQCEIVEAEIAAGERTVVQSPHWVAYVPFAARWPYEVRIVPRRHVGRLPHLTSAERDDLAAVYPDVLGRFDRLFSTPAPYIGGWDQSPNGPLGPTWHLSADVFTIRRAEGKLKYLAGSESGAAVWINDIAPERAAAALRDAGAEPSTRRA
jgi:UDPglucose--hexose-1-phosphate uridylyltransferase